MTKLSLLALVLSSAAPVFSAGQRDAFTLRKQGAFRGANVMQAQCTVEDLSVLRVGAPTWLKSQFKCLYRHRRMHLKPENLAKVDKAVRPPNRRTCVSL